MKKLEIGHNSTFEIRKELISNKDLNGLKLIFLSDFHLNKYSLPIVESLISSLEKIKPDLILLGGDFLDSKGGIPYFELFLSGISPIGKVFAILGNHDYWWQKYLKQCFAKFNVHLLAESETKFYYKEHTILISNNPKSIRLHPFQILLMHKPIKLGASNFDVAFAGHLHGCQFVFWQKDQKLFPGAFFYPMNQLKLQEREFSYFISKGLGDTLPIRYNCKKDFLYLQFTDK